jgi:hypothetical protein
MCDKSTRPIGKGGRPTISILRRKGEGKFYLFCKTKV